MKKLLNILALSAVALAAFSCNDAEYGVSEEIEAFFVESFDATGIAGLPLLVTDDGATAELTVSLTKKTRTGASFRLVVDQAVLDQYNKENNMVYSVLDEAYYDLGGEITIEPDAYSALPVQISISPVPNELSGSLLAIPVRLEKVSGDAGVTSTTSTYVIVVNTILRSTLPMFNGRPDLTVVWPEGTWTTTEYTFEGKFQIALPYDRDRVFFKNQVDGDDASVNFILTRWEDPQTAPHSGRYDHDGIQYLGRGRAHFNPGEDDAFYIKPDVWQHYAITFDGSTATMYVNGRNAATNTYASGTTTFQHSGWFIQGDDAANHWSGAKIIVTELRIWRTCRTAEQITNNINNTGTPNADLVAYWRLNKESYNEAEGYFEDLSGNGVLLQTSSSTNITWIEDIESTATSTPWP